MSYLLEKSESDSEKQPLLHCGIFYVWRARKRRRRKRRRRRKMEKTVSVCPTIVYTVRCLEAFISVQRPNHARASVP